MRQDSNSSLVVKLSLVDKQGKILAFDGKEGRPFTNDVFSQFDVTMSGFNSTSWSGQLVLTDTQGAAEEIILGIASGMLVVVDFNYADAFNTPHPIYEGLVLSVGYDLQDTGVSVILELCSSSVVGGLTTDKVLTWPEGTPAHQVFLDIASTYRWVTRDGGQSTVFQKSSGIPVALTLDPTQGRPEVWVRDKLLPYAFTTPRPGFPFTLATLPAMDGGKQSVMHFYPEGWSPAAQNYSDVPAAVYEYRRGDGTVLSAKISDNSLSAAVQGAYNMESSGADSLTGTALSARIKNTAGVLTLSGEAVSIRLAPVGRTQGNLAAPEVPGETPDVLTFYDHTPSRDPLTLMSKMAAKVNFLARSNYSISFAMQGEAGILPHVPFTFVYRTQKGAVHFISGRYRAREVSHSVTQSGWVTQVDAYRSSIGSASPYETIASPADRVDDGSANGTVAASPTSSAGTSIPVRNTP